MSWDTLKYLVDLLLGLLGLIKPPQAYLVWLRGRAVR